MPSIQHQDAATGITNHPVLLQADRSLGHAFATHAQIGGSEFKLKPNQRQVTMNKPSGSQRLAALSTAAKISALVLAGQLSLARCCSDQANAALAKPRLTAPVAEQNTVQIRKTGVG